MGMTTLYGRGSITFSDDRNTYRVNNGVLVVPDHLVARAKAAGFTNHPLPSIEEAPRAPNTGSDVEGFVLGAGLDREPPAPIDPSLTDEILFLRFATEAVDAGYAEKAAENIANNRVRHLRAGGDGYNQLAEGQTLADLAKA